MGVTRGVRLVDVISQVHEPALILESQITWQGVAARGVLTFEIVFPGRIGTFCRIAPHVLIRSGGTVLVDAGMREPMDVHFNKDREVVSLDALMAHPTAYTESLATYCLAHLVANRCRLTISCEEVMSEPTASRLALTLASGRDSYESRATVPLNEPWMSEWFARPG